MSIAVLGGCSRLSLVDCSQNQLRALPEAFGDLAHLTELQLSRNMLVGSVHINGVSLERLNLSNNRIASLELSGCDALSELSVAYNQLARLPSALGSGALRSLATADLSNNKLGALSAEMTRLNALQRLDVSNNSLKEVPAELGLMTQLSTLSLHGNLLRSMPSSVINGPNSKLLAHLRSKLPES